MYPHEYESNRPYQIKYLPLQGESPVSTLRGRLQLDSLNRAGAIKEGEIVISIQRDTTQSLLTEDFKGLHPVVGFTIEDNGVGFTEGNFSSFQEADTLRKQARGGRGVGRLYWLKAFHKAHIESTFEQDGKSFKRVFDFELTRQGVENHSICEAADGQHKTLVQLIGLKADYREKCPKLCETIARKIIDHFLRYFILDSCPRIVLDDEHTGDRRILNKMFQVEMRLQRETETFDIKGHRFSLENLRILSTSREPEHELHFCAHNRSVRTENLSRLLPNLSGPLQEEGGAQFAYSGYVSAGLLDENVAQDRTKFLIPEDAPLIEISDEITWDKVVNEAAGRAKQFLEPYLEPIRQKKLERIKEYVQNRPRYRHLLKLRPQWIDQLRADLKDDELDLELYKLSKRLEIEIQEQGLRLQRERSEQTTKSLQKHKERFSKYLSEWNELGISKLAEYVVHRRAVLDFFAECMALTPEGKYRLEDVIHDVIFPMKATSDDTPDPDQTNLWIIDERLAYHFYLASDLQFGQIDPLQVDGEVSKDRMDLVVLRSFDRPHAFVESSRPFNSVTIIEFKRPMRDDYTEKREQKDPVAQVWRYVHSIREGRVKDQTGQFIRVSPDTPFYAYIICTFSPNMEELARHHQFTPTPDGMGFFNYHPNYRAYTEIISYDKLISDAKKRNQVFFEKFNLPPQR